MGETRSARSALWAMLFVAAWAMPAAAQSAISGVVRDASGAAMPGVTVEASSPVLIEKVKLTMTDGNGGYRITDLRPGTYAVTFTLTGFSTYRRDGFELPDNFTGTLNATLTVGALE
ncbi:MAG: carboxypeptidase-like regulatory domain-containing protein, partial [Vicinamibacterales bacterium]